MTVVIENHRGLHARAAAKFVETANKFNASVEVSRLGQTVSGNSILGLMMLAASKGSEIQLIGTGPECGAALDAIAKLIELNFYEEY